MADEHGPVRAHTEIVGPDERRAKRVRASRLSVLPFLFDFSRQGWWQRGVALFVHAALCLAIAAPLVRLLSGEWISLNLVFAIIPLDIGLQALYRFLNGRAGRG